WRLLIDLSGQALAGQGDGSGKSSDPAADNRDFRSHAGTLPDCPGGRPDRAGIPGLEVTGNSTVQPMGMPAPAFTAIQPPPEPGQQGCWHRGARRASPTTCGR